VSAAKTALVVEGGGLRGAFSVGVLQVLLSRFGADAFDGIFAVSSGVFASTYFVANQGAEMESIWRDRVCGSQLIDHRNWFTGRPVLRLDYLIDLFKGPVKLDLDLVMNSRPYLEYVLTDHRTRKPVHIDAKCPDIFDLMRASSALPHVYKLPVTVAGRDFYDGGQSDPIPVRRAIEFGATHIVVVRTRPRSYVKKPLLPWLERTPLQNRYNETVRLIEERSSSSGPAIVSINPTSVLVGRLTRNQRRIAAAIDHGKDVADHVIAANPEFFGVVIQRRSGARPQQPEAVQRHRDSSAGVGDDRQP
jgi:predicted patatin/cPLA2 family phospholipase